MTSKTPRNLNRSIFDLFLLLNKTCNIIPSPKNFGVHVGVCFLFYIVIYFSHNAHKRACFASNIRFHCSASRFCFAPKCVVLHRKAVSVRLQGIVKGYVRKSKSTRYAGGYLLETIKFSLNARMIPFWIRVARNFPRDKLKTSKSCR